MGSDLHENIFKIVMHDCVGIKKNIIQAEQYPLFFSDFKEMNIFPWAPKSIPSSSTGPIVPAGKVREVDPGHAVCGSPFKLTEATL